MYRPCNEIRAGSDVTQTDPALAHRSRFGWRGSVHSKNDSRFTRQRPNEKAVRPDAAGGRSEPAAGWAW